MPKLIRFFIAGVIWTVVSALNLSARADVDETTKAQALAILDRIERNPNLTTNGFLDNVRTQLDTARGTNLLRANYQLLLLGTLSDEEVRAITSKLAKLAQEQGNGSYYAIARSYEIFNEFLDGTTDRALPKLEHELKAAQATQDWLAESQVRQLITYVAWSLGQREYAVQNLTEAFSKIPEGADDADLAKVSLLSALRYVQADSGDLSALVETATQTLDLAERTGLPVAASLIVRNFAYLFRLRGDYDVALRFYEAYDHFMSRPGHENERYIALFGLALTTHRMNDFATSARYVDQALHDFPIPPSYDAPLKLIQSINLARLGRLDAARGMFDEAHAYFSRDTSSYNDSWRAELIHARAEIARAEGRLDDALDLSEDFLEKYIGIVRSESSSEVKQLRADLAAELARERAERTLLEREGELQQQRLRGQTITLILLGIIIFGLGIAYLMQRKAAAALDASRKRAEAANAAKSRFLANMSHELRTPLNAVIGFSEMLMMDRPTPIRAGQTQEYAGLINKSGQHLLDIISDILNIAQVETEDAGVVRSTCSFRAILEDARVVIDRQADITDKRIIYQVPDNLPDLCVDKRRMTQVLINLLSNALKFTGEAPHIELSARVDKEGRFVVSIVDNGIGIPADKLHSVLEPFVQVNDGWDRTHQGVGLGLSIVKAIIEQHGGTMDLWSKLGHGTSVTLSLPARCIASGLATSSGTTKSSPATAAA